MARHAVVSERRVGSGAIILLTALCVWGLPAAARAATDTPTRDLIKCGKIIVSQAAAFMKVERTLVGKCTQALLACDMKFENGEITSEQLVVCVDKAKLKCTRAKEKEAEQEAKRKAKLILKCQDPPVTFSDVQDLPEGLGFGLGPCQAETNLTDFVDCLKGSQTLELALEDVTIALPRSRELLEAAGIAGDFPDLPPPPCGNGILNAGEECDDGNFVDGDGCSKECKIEGGALLRMLDRMLAWLGLDELGVAHAETPVTPTLKCGKRIEREIRKFMNLEVKKVSACALSYVHCDLKFVNGDISSDAFLRCKAAADVKCDRAKDVEAAAKTRSAAKIQDGCGSVAFSSVMGGGGLGYGLGVCSQEPDLDALVDCLVAATEAEDRALLAVSLLVPRARELLVARAQELGQSVTFEVPDPRCGNGIVEGDEACDDGNTTPADGCEPDCVPSSCGDEVVEPCDPDQEHVPQNDLGGLEVTAAQSVGQTFTVGLTGRLTRIDVTEIRQHRCPATDPLLFELVPAPGGSPSSTVLASRVVLPSLITPPGSAFGPLSIDLGDFDVQVSGGDVLAILLSSNAPPSGCTYAWNGDFPGGYGNGTGLLNGFDSSRDMAFRTFVNCAGGEECDGGDLNGQTCTSLGRGDGPLACNADCTFDTSACATCGNGAVEGGESCDPPFANGGAPGCDPNCQNRCGDGVRNPGLGEDCDGPDDELCLGQCQLDCTCPP